MHRETDRSYQAFWIFFFFSLLSHLYLLFSPSRVDFLPKSTPEDNKEDVNFLKIRTIGKKDAKREEFSMPTDKSSQSKILRPKELTLDALAPNPGPISEIKESSSVEQFLSPKVQSRLQTKLKMQQEVLQKVATSPQSRRALEVGSLDLAYTPPKGVPEDEFNSFEKIFYAFQKRVFEQFLRSYVSQYNAQTSLNPTLEHRFLQQDFYFKAVVAYDSDGHILTIDITDSVPDQALHHFFEETIKNIGNLPNPPKFFVDGKEKFNYIYILRKEK